MCRSRIIAPVLRALWWFPWQPVVAVAASTERREAPRGQGATTECANKLVNAFTGPLFGIFLIAMFSTRARSESALAGGLAGAVASYYVAYHTRIGFLWPSTFGLPLHPRRAET